METRYGLILVSAYPNEAGAVDIAAVGYPLRFVTPPNEIAAQSKVRDQRGVSI